MNSFLDIIFERDRKKFDDNLVQCCEEVLAVLQFRYSGPRTIKILKSKDWFNNILPSYDDDRFKSCLRVTRSDFSTLLELISPLPIFKTKTKMFSVDVQLAITLYRFGCDGSGVSYWKVGHQFGISDCGSILNCTQRVIKVRFQSKYLINISIHLCNLQAFLHFENDFIIWPNVNERIVMQNFMEDKLPGCIGYLDGCHIPLFQAPLEHHESYFSRKQQYGIQLQAICDNHLLFRNITVGYPASAHDARVFSNSPVGMFPNQYFSEGQWVAADSAYRLTDTVLTPFRDNSNFGIAIQRKKYNRYFSGIYFFSLRLNYK
jgi:hypothetical protein